MIVVLFLFYSALFIALASVPLWIGSDAARDETSQVFPEPHSLDGEQHFRI
jgi:hypothetical protein